MQTNNQSTEGKDPQPTTGETSLDGAACSPSANSWAEVPPLIEARPAEYETVAYDISRAIQGNEVVIDFGDYLGEVEMIRLTFRDNRTAWAAYCKGLRIGVKVVAHPEHDLIVENVQEHATPLAGAGVGHGVRVHDTGGVVNKAARGGCSVSPCSLILFIFGLITR